MVVGGRKGDGVVGGVRGGSAKNGTHHLINIGNSLHIFVASPDNESFKKKTRHLITRRIFAFASMKR